MLYVISLLITLPWVVIPMGKRIGKNHGLKMGR